MLKVAYDAVNEVEAVLLMFDASKGIREKDELLMSQLKEKIKNTPVIAAINKTDLVSLGDIDEIQERLEKESWIKQIIPISAETGRNVDKLEKLILGYLVEGPQYFPDDMVTDQPERVICGEIVREKALLLLSEEIPHGIGVGVDKMEMRKGGGLMDVYATIYCERESHKGIIIGRHGSMLKKIGEQARKDVEWLLGCRVNLQLWVKIKEDWRNKPAVLHELGYE